MIDYYTIPPHDHRAVYRVRQKAVEWWNWVSRGWKASQIYRDEDDLMRAGAKSIAAAQAAKLCRKLGR